MSEEKVVSDDSNKVGDQVDGNVDDSQPKGKETVAYDTYQRVLRQKKANDAELEKFRAEEKSRKEKELQDQNKYQEIIKMKDEEISSLKGENNQFHQAVEDYAKQQEVMSHFEGFVVPDKLKSMMDLSQVGYDRSTKLVNQDEAKLAAETFKKEFGEFLKPIGSTKPDLPNQAPKTDSVTFNDMSAKEKLKSSSEELFAALGG